jgi:hypothetical protein
MPVKERNQDMNSTVKLDRHTKEEELEHIRKKYKEQKK